MVKLVLIRGHAGAGKSTVAPKVADKMKGPVIVIPKDPIVFGFHFSEIKQDELHSQGVIAAVSQIYLSKKISVIVEGVFGGSNAKKKIAHFKRIAKKNNAEFYVVNLTVDIKSALARNKVRNKTISDKEIKKCYKHFDAIKINNAFVLDNNELTANLAAKKIVDYVEG